MIFNGKDVSAPRKAQVCVIGSGPAGITAAWELSAKGLDVILLDGSRQLDYSQPRYFLDSFKDKSNLYAGVAEGIFSPLAYTLDGQPQLSTFLTRPFDGNTVGNQPEERERVYGGTPTHGGGQCRPLDWLAFEKRPGFPGWPIARGDLDPYYAKACTLNHLYGDYGEVGGNFTAAFWAGQILNTAVPHLKYFNAEMYQCMEDRWVNFATRTFDEKNKIQHVARVIVNATLLNIVAQGGSVKYLEVASMEDKYPNENMGTPKVATTFRVTADAYILACGAIENARRLLLSGIGNNLVGHYFMCHPFTHIDVITTTKNYLQEDEYDLMKDNPGDRWNLRLVTGRLVITDEKAREEKIGKCWFWPQWARPNDESDRFPKSSKMYMEMTPNYYSYVGLADLPPDPVFGQKQTYINWQLTDLDKKTYETNCSLFKEASSGSIKCSSWEDIKNEWMINGHHLGTTRMSASTDPTSGVVDENLRIHGMDNLYVAGSSVFPTAGTSNPTMTIVALSIRLAEYILQGIKPTAKVVA